MTKPRTTKPATKKSPTPTTAKSNGAGPQVDTPKRSGASLPASRSAEFPLLPPLFDLALDPHQTRMVAFLSERLGGTHAEVLEFLVTAGLYAMQLDPIAEGRVAGGLKMLYAGTELDTVVMEALRDVECSHRWEVDRLVASLQRPRMIGDWRGVAVVAEV